MSTTLIMTGLTKGEDLLAEVKRVALENGITKGAVQVIGALEKATLGYYYQDRKEYETHEVNKNVELLAGVGSISIMNDDTFVHLHLTLSDETGAAMGGHAMEGCPIFAAECVIREIDGAPLTRAHDEATGLMLWDE